MPGDGGGVGKGARSCQSSHELFPHLHLRATCRFRGLNISVSTPLGQIRRALPSFPIPRDASMVAVERDGQAVKRQLENVVFLRSERRIEDVPSVQPSQKIPAQIF